MSRRGLTIRAWGQTPDMPLRTQTCSRFVLSDRNLYRADPRLLRISTRRSLPSSVTRQVLTAPWACTVRRLLLQALRLTGSPPPLARHLPRTRLMQALPRRPRTRDRWVLVPWESHTSMASSPPTQIPTTRRASILSPGATIGTPSIPRPSRLCRTLALPRCRARPRHTQPWGLITAALRLGHLTWLTRVGINHLRQAHLVTCPRSPMGAVTPWRDRGQTTP